jgi:hypothetical protein
VSAIYFYPRKDYISNILMFGHGTGVLVLLYYWYQSTIGTRVLGTGVLIRKYC